SYTLRDQAEDDGEDGERGEQAAGRAESEEEAEAVDALVARDHQASEAHHGTDSAQGDRHHRASCHEGTAMIAALEVAEHHVQAEFRGSADDEGQAPHIAHFELDVDSGYEH